MKLKKSIDIKGLVVSLYNMKKDNEGNVRRLSLYRRRLVNPAFIKLLFDFLDEDNKDGVLSESSVYTFKSMDDVDRDFMTLCLRESGVESRAFEELLAEASNGLYERMKLLEDGLKAGVVSDKVVSEFNDIVDRLVVTGQFTKHYGSKLKGRMKNTKKFMSA